MSEYLTVTLTHLAYPPTSRVRALERFLKRGAKYVEKRLGRRSEAQRRERGPIHA